MTDRGSDGRTRRSVLAAVSGGVAAGLAGCSGGDGGDTGDTNTGDGGDGGGFEFGGTGTATSSPSGADGGTPWMTSHGDPELTRSTPDVLPETLERVASVELEGNATNTHPLVTGDRLVANVTDMGVEASLLGVDLQSRERAFARALTPEFGGFVREGTLVVATTDNVLGLNLADGERQWILGETGMVFPVPEGVGIVTGEGTARKNTLRVVDPETGDLRWERSYADESDRGDLNEVSRLSQLRGMPTLRNSLQSLHVPVHRDSETVYAGAGQTVDALDARTGERRWQYTREDSEGNATFSPSPAPFAVHGDTLYLELEVDRGLLALDRADGTRRWERTDGRVASEFTYAVDDDGLYYFNPREAEAVALDPADGTELWSTPFQTSGATRAKLSPVAASDGVVFTPNQQLRVLSKATGESQRSVDIEEPRSLAVVGGRIYALHSSPFASLSIYGSG